MDFEVEELKYSNKVKSKSNKVEISGKDGEIVLNFSNEEINGKIKLEFDEIREIWAELLKYDKTESEDISKKFDDNLYEANQLANKLSIGDYEEKKLELDDIKKFMKVYADLIEHAKFGLATKKELEKQQDDLIHENSKLKEIKEKQIKFDKEAKEISDKSNTLFPKEKFEGEAIEFEELLRRMEEEKLKNSQNGKNINKPASKIKSDKIQTPSKAIKPMALKSPKEIKLDNSLEEKKISNMMSTTDIADIISENKKEHNSKEIHINSDDKKVNALFPEQKQTVGNVMKRKSNLDNIDFSNL